MIKKWYIKNKKLYEIESKYSVMYDAIESDDIELFRRKMLEVYIESGCSLPYLLFKITNVSDESCKSEWHKNNKLLAKIWLSGVLNYEN